MVLYGAMFIVQSNSSGVINKPTPVFKKDATAKVESGIIQGGCGNLIFKYMQAFSTNVNLGVYINGSLAYTATTSSEVSVIKTSDTIKVNAPGAFTMKFQQINASSGQVSIDDIKWTGYLVSDVKNNESNAPSTFVLNQNYPNPFNPETTISYSISNECPVTLKVYNMLGELVSTLVDQYQKAGSHQVIFNAQKLASGAYFYRLSRRKFFSREKTYFT